MDDDFKLPPVAGERLAEEVGLKAQERHHQGVDVYSLRENALAGQAAPDAVSLTPFMGKNMDQYRELGDLSIEDIMGSAVPSRQVPPGHQQYMRELQEDIYAGAAHRAHLGPEVQDDLSLAVSSQMQPAPPRKGRFVLEKAEARTTSGGRLPVWIIIDTRSDIKVGRPLKIFETAQILCQEMNQNGARSPNVQKILQNYDQYNTLLREVQTVRKAIEQGQEEKRPRLSVLREHLKDYGRKIGLV